MDYSKIIDLIETITESKVLLLSIVGSQKYKYAENDSDYDILAVTTGDESDHIRLGKYDESLSNYDVWTLTIVDTVEHAIDDFFEMPEIFTPIYCKSNELYQFTVENRNRLLNSNWKNMYNSFIINYEDQDASGRIPEELIRGAFLLKNYYQTKTFNFKIDDECINLIRRLNKTDIMQDFCVYYLDDIRSDKYKSFFENLPIDYNIINQFIKLLIDGCIPLLKEESKLKLASELKLIEYILSIESEDSKSTELASELLGLLCSEEDYNYSISVIIKSIIKSMPDNTNEEVLSRIKDNLIQLELEKRCPIDIFMDSLSLKLSYDHISFDNLEDTLNQLINLYSKLDTIKAENFKYGVATLILNGLLSFNSILNYEDIATELMNYIKSYTLDYKFEFSVFNSKDI